MINKLRTIFKKTYSPALIRYKINKFKKSYWYQLYSVIINNNNHRIMSIFRYDNKE